jgi:hypothetical protein
MADIIKWAAQPSGIEGRTELRNDIEIKLPHGTTAVFVGVVLDPLFNKVSGSKRPTVWKPRQTSGVNLTFTHPEDGYGSDVSSFYLIGIPISPLNSVFAIDTFSSTDGESRYESLWSEETTYTNIFFTVTLPDIIDDPLFDINAGLGAADDVIAIGDSSISGTVFPTSPEIFDGIEADSIRADLGVFGRIEADSAYFIGLRADSSRMRFLYSDSIRSLYSYSTIGEAFSLISDSATINNVNAVDTVTVNLTARDGVITTAQINRTNGGSVYMDSFVRAGRYMLDGGIYDRNDWFSDIKALAEDNFGGFYYIKEDLTGKDEKIASLKYNEIDKIWEFNPPLQAPESVTDSSMHHGTGLPGQFLSYSKYDSAYVWDYPMVVARFAYDSDEVARLLGDFPDSYAVSQYLKFETYRHEDSLGKYPGKLRAYEENNWLAPFVPNSSYQYLRGLVFDSVNETFGFGHRHQTLISAGPSPENPDFVARYLTYRGYLDGADSPMLGMDLNNSMHILTNAFDSAAGTMNRKNEDYNWDNEPINPAEGNPSFNPRNEIHGFHSPDPVKKYTLEATMSATDGLPQMGAIGILVGLVKSASEEKTLTLFRSTVDLGRDGSTGPYTYVYNQPPGPATYHKHTVFNYSLVYNAFKPDSKIIYSEASDAPTPNTNMSWDSAGSTTVKIEKNEAGLKIDTTPFGSSTFIANQINIDLNQIDYRSGVDLSIFAEDVHWGFAFHNISDATVSNIKFSALDTGKFSWDETTVVDLKNRDTYLFYDAAKAAEYGETVGYKKINTDSNGNDILGGDLQTGRFYHNPETKKTWYQDPWRTILVGQILQDDENPALLIPEGKVELRATGVGLDVRYFIFNGRSLDRIRKTGPLDPGAEYYDYAADFMGLTFAKLSKFGIIEDVVNLGPSEYGSLAALISAMDDGDMGIIHSGGVWSPSSIPAGFEAACLSVNLARLASTPSTADAHYVSGLSYAGIFQVGGASYEAAAQPPSVANGVDNHVDLVVQFLSNTFIVQDAQQSPSALTNWQGDIAARITNKGHLFTDTVELTGQILGPSNLIIDPATHGDSTGLVTIKGNLTVNGTTTTVNSTEVTIADKNIILASGAPDAASADGAGIDIDGPPAYIRWMDDSTGIWTFSHPFATSPNVLNNYTTDMVQEGDINEYHTNERVRELFSAANTGTGTYAQLSYTEATGVYTLNVDSLETAELPELDISTANTGTGTYAQLLAYNAATGTITLNVDALDANEIPLLPAAKIDPTGGPIPPALMPVIPESAITDKSDAIADALDSDGYYSDFTIFHGDPTGPGSLTYSVATGQFDITFPHSFSRFIIADNGTNVTLESRVEPSAGTPSSGRDAITWEGGTGIKLIPTDASAFASDHVEVTLYAWLDSLQDVTITDPQQYDKLEYTGSIWENVSRPPLTIGPNAVADSVDGALFYDSATGILQYKPSFFIGQLVGADGSTTTLTADAQNITFASTNAALSITALNQTVTFDIDEDALGGGTTYTAVANKGITVDATNETLAMSGDYTGDFTVTGEIRATGNIIAAHSSDSRLKENIEKINNSLDKVSSLSGYTFNWNEKAKGRNTDLKDVGVIAQEVEAVMPEIVIDRIDGYKAVYYEKLIPLLIESIKELKERIEKLENK